MKILFIYLFLFSILSKVLSEQWIDPHDMNTNSKKHLKKSYSTGDLTYATKECNVDAQENNSLVYLKRVINLLLTSADISKGNVAHHGQLQFKISNEDLNFLKSFSAIENIKIEHLRKVDVILTESFEKSSMDSIASMLSSAQDKMYHFVSSQNSLPLIALAFCFPYVAYNLFRSNFSLWYAIRYLLLMVFMIDFVERSQQLRQEADEHNNQLKYSLKCDTSKMTWTEYFRFMAGHEDCEVRIVSLLEVFLNQVKSVIIIPLSAAGTGMGHFGAELWKNLPFPWNILIFPIMLIFCAIIIAITMTTMNNTPFKINLMHLFHLEFGEKKQTITGKTLDKLLDAVNHRPLLQDVQSAKDKSPPKKNKAQVKEGRSWPKKSERKSGENGKQKRTKPENEKEEVVGIVETPHFDNTCEGNSS